MRVNTRDKLYTILICFLTVIALYVGISSFIFSYRNPLANSASVFRDFKAVMTFEKLTKYQPKD